MYGGSVLFNKITSGLGVGVDKVREFKEEIKMIRNLTPEDRKILNEILRLYVMMKLLQFFKKSMPLLNLNPVLSPINTMTGDALPNHIVGMIDKSIESFSYQIIRLTEKSGLSQKLLEKIKSKVSKKIEKVVYLDDDDLFDTHSTHDGDGDGDDGVKLVFDSPDIDGKNYQFTIKEIK